MRRARDIVGLPVLDLSTGNQVGWVQDIVFDSNHDQVVGLIMEGKNFFQGEKGIPIKSVVSVGKDALTVDKVELEELQGVRWSQKIGNQVYTKAGDGKGTIEDIYLDDAAQHITGFEVSDGLIADLFLGRSSISEQQVIVDGTDVLIVDDGAAPQNQDSKGGLE